MASRYWVAGVGVWNATAGTKWATTSGGAGGSAVPTASDDVFLDASPAPVWVTLTAYALAIFRRPTTPNGFCYEVTTAGTTGVLEPTWPTTAGNTVNDGTVVWTCRDASVTVGASDVCLSFDATGFAGVLAGSSALAVSGSWTFGSAMSVTNTSTITFNSTTTGKTITSNGKSFGGAVTFNGVGGGWTLADAYSSVGTTTLTNGAFSDGGFSLTANAFSSSNSNTRSVTKSGTWTLTGSGTVTNFTTVTGLTWSDTGSWVFSYSGASSRVVGGAVVLGNMSVTAGSGTINTGQSSGTWKDMNFTGFTGDWNAGNHFITGDLTLGAGMTMSDIANNLTFSKVSGAQTITSNGVAMNRQIIANNTGSTLTFADNTNIGTRDLNLQAGAIDTNNKDISMRAFVSSTSNARTLNLGSSTVTITSNASTSPGGVSWQTPSAFTGLTLNAGTSTIKFTDTSANNKNMNPGPYTYNCIWFAGNGTGINQLQNTALVAPVIINELKIDSAPKNFTFLGDTGTGPCKYEINTLTGFTGSVGNLISIAAVTAGNPYTLTKDGSIFEGDYLSVTDCKGTDGYKWFMGKHSVNGGNNKGVAFDTPQGASQWLLAA